MPGLRHRATLAVNVGHGLGHGLIDAAVGSAWPAVALIGSHELLMMIVRGTQQTAGGVSTETEQAVAGMPHALRAQAAEEFANDVTAGRPPSIRVVSVRLHVGQPRALSGARVPHHACGGLGQSRGRASALGHGSGRAPAPVNPHRRVSPAK